MMNQWISRFDQVVAVVSRLLIATALALVVSAEAHAGQILGKITAIDYGKRIVEISGFSYRFSPVAVDNKDTERPRRIELSSFRYGQVVRYQLENGEIVGMELVPDADDIPR